MQDPLADQTDVDRLQKELGKRVIFRANYDHFDHFGFQEGKDMSYTNDVLALLEKVGGPRPKKQKKAKA